MSFLFSIIVPVYNVENYIVECLKSIEEQECYDFEVILVNDGSTDKSKDICENFIESKSNFFLYSQENQGLSAARNTGIEKARGEYLVFLDSDDYLSNGALVNIQKSLAVHKVDILVNRFKYLDEISNELTESIALNKKDSHYSRALSFYNKHVNVDGNWISAWCCIVNREFIINNNLFFQPGILHEDELWVPTIFTKASSYNLNDHCYYIYRVNRSGSIMSSVKAKNESHKVFICKKLLSLDVDDKSKKIINRRVSDLFFSTIIVSQVHLNFEESNKIRPEIIDNIILLRNGRKKVFYYIYKIWGFNVLSATINTLYKIKHLRK